MIYDLTYINTQDNVDARKEVSAQYYIVEQLCSSISSTYKSLNDKLADDKPKDDTSSKTIKEPVNKEDQAYKDELDRLMSQENNPVNAASTSGTFSAVGPSSPYPDAFIPANTLLHVDHVYDDDLDKFDYPVQSIGVEADFNNMESSTIISLIPTHKVHLDHPKDQILGDPTSSVPTRGMVKKSFGAYALISYIHNLHKVWRLVDLPYGKKAIRTKWVYKNKKDERGIVVRNKARLVAQGHRQEEGIDYDEVFAPMARIKAIRIFLAFTSFMGFLVYLMDVKSAFLYDTIEEEVYVTPKLSHLQAMKRKFRYLKGQPKLSLWYPRDSPFDLEAYSDSDYTGANLDRKSTTRGCQFLSRRLILWQCNKQTIVATSTTEVEYVDAAHCYRQTEENAEFHQIVDFLSTCSINYALTVVVVSESSVRSDLLFNDEDDIRADEAVHQEEGDSVEMDITIDASLDAAEESDRPRHQETTLGGANAQTRFETTSKRSSDPPFSTGHTVGSGEETMEQETDLTDFVPPTLNDSPLSGGHTPGSNEDLVIQRLLKKVKRLEKKQRVRTPGMKLFKIGTSKKKTLDKEYVSKQERDESKEAKELNLSNKGSSKTKVFDYTAAAKKDVNHAEPISTAGDAVNAASVVPDVSVAGPSTSTAGDIFEDEMITMADTLMAIRRTRPRTSSVVIHDVEEEPMRATPPPIVQSQDKEVNESEQQAESSKKRQREVSVKESSKKQRIEENNIAEKEELKVILDIVPRDDIAINVESLAAKHPIVDWKTYILIENMMYYQIIRADRSSKNYKIFSEILKDFDRQDVIDLHRLVKERHETTSPKGYDLLL
nr:hypothetical protein [Tanacetum cinerariifolium]